MSNLKEYKSVRLDLSRFEDLTVINANAKEGWRVVSVIPIVTAYAAPEAAYIMERDVI